MTSFVGRSSELQAITSLLDAQRLVTLAGPGGSGKTRLAVEAARTRHDRHSEVWFVDLSTLTEAGRVEHAIVSSVGAPEGEADGEPLDGAIAVLAEGDPLIVLDNCEQVAAACADAARRLLTSCAGLSILATSREPLRVPGESVWQTPPLGGPTAPGRADGDAVALFVERARLVRPGYDASDDAAWVETLCTRLDRQPLALELAAARLNLLTPRQIVDRLDERFQLLASREAGVPERQRTLRALIAWSEQLLDEPVRQLLWALSVFPGSFDIDAVDTVVGPGHIDDLATLVEQSLVQVEVGDGFARYRLLESVRLYAAEHCTAAGELRSRHLQWCLDLARSGAEGLGTAEGVRWLGRLDAELPNFRAAVAFGSRERPDDTLELCAALGRFLQIRSYVAEGRAWLEEALRHGTQRAAPRGIALNVLGTLAEAQGDRATMRAAYEEALQIFRDLGDDARAAGVTGNLGNAARADGDLEQAVRLHTESLEAFRRAGREESVAISLNDLANALMESERPEAAAAHYEESATLMRRLGRRWALARVLGNLGSAVARSDPARAGVLLEEAAAIADEVGDRLQAASVLCGLADLHERAGRADDAAGALSRAAHLYGEIGDDVKAAEVRRRIDELRDSGASYRPAPAGNSFVREGDVWAIGFDGAETRVRDLKGMRYLSVLLASPGREFFVLDLVATVEGTSAAAPSDAGVALDEAAKAAYRARIQELRDEMDEAEQWDDDARASRAGEELDRLREELARAVGLGGRDVRAGSVTERARSTVTKAIRSAMKRVAEAMPALGEHLETTVRTGAFCSYRPDPRAEPAWRVR